MARCWRAPGLVPARGGCPAGFSGAVCAVPARFHRLVCRGGLGVAPGSGRAGAGCDGQRSCPGGAVSLVGTGAHHALVASAGLVAPAALPRGVAGSDGAVLPPAVRVGRRQPRHIGRSIGPARVQQPGAVAAFDGTTGGQSGRPGGVSGTRSANGCRGTLQRWQFALLDSPVCPRWSPHCAGQCRWGGGVLLLAWRLSV